MQKNLEVPTESWNTALSYGFHFDPLKSNTALKFDIRTNMHSCTYSIHVRNTNMVRQECHVRFAHVGLNRIITFVNLFNQVKDQENYRASKEAHQLFSNKSLQMRLLQTVAMKCVISCLVEFMKVVTDTDTNSHLELCPTLENFCQYLMKKLLE